MRRIVRPRILRAAVGTLLIGAGLVAGTGIVYAHHGDDYAPNSLTHFVIGWNHNYDGFHEDDPGQEGGSDESKLAEETRGGNTTCSTGTALLKLDPVKNGVHELSDGSQIIISNYDGKTFDWAIHEDSLHDIDASLVLVKGGPATMAYFYGSQEDFDTGLSAPLNKDEPYGISHVSFCFDPKGEVDNPFD